MRSETKLRQTILLNLFGYVLMGPSHDNTRWRFAGLMQHRNHRNFCVFWRTIS